MDSISVFEDFSFKHVKGGMIDVYDVEGDLVAKVQSEGGKVTNITLKKRGVDKGALFEGASKYVVEVLGGVPIVEGKKGGPKMPTVKQAKVAKKATTKEERRS